MLAWVADSKGVGGIGISGGRRESWDLGVGGNGKSSDVGIGGRGESGVRDRGRVGELLADKLQILEAGRVTDFWKSKG